MRKRVILITGAAGEIGQALVHHLTDAGSYDIVTLDLHPLPADVDHKVNHMVGDILDQTLFARLVTEYEFDAIYHLAALLSTRAEFSPMLAHQVNVNGTLNLLNMAAEQSQRRGRPVRFLFPSSIAVYGMPSLDIKARDAVVREWEWNDPTTMYGANKLYCERLGTYFAQHYQQLAANPPVMVDFRALRFPGLISAFTLPTGGTSDYGPEMLHAAARGEPYAAFVRPDTTIPFMAMPDAVKALLDLAAAPADSLSRRVYNVTSFSLSADDFKNRVLGFFPDAAIDFNPDAKRQGIVDSWPAGIDDRRARRDWGWAPEYDIDRAFAEYLVPNIRRRYA